MLAANAAALSQSHCARGLTAEVAAHGDALRIDRPRERRLQCLWPVFNDIHGEQWRSPYLLAT